MATDDRDMVARFLRGETEAVGTVDGWIARAAWPYQRRLADRWDDVLQDVRLEVTRLLGQGKFRGESSLRTYLWRVVSHTCLDQLRTQGKWKLVDLDTLDQGKDPVVAFHVPTPNREDRDLLFRVLQRVPQDCREMWGMILAGLSYKEMSLRLNVAAGTLRVRVLRCREKATALRRDLLDGGPGNGRNAAVKSSPNQSEMAKPNDL
ncbi:MAG TPA: sigma-70 family RNA polymerase sigma factor [Thermoanaerobaculia bacterium]|nr:sigma-70 family RNA polymerase sigma factor [Thermoanaerobaculia bacterium]